MSNESCRSNYMGKTFDALLWVQSKRAPFTRQQMARELEISPRTALRFLHCLETRAIVSSSKPDRVADSWMWMTAPIVEAL